MREQVVSTEMKVNNNNAVQSDTNPVLDSGAPWPFRPPLPTPSAWPETRPVLLPSVPPGAATAAPSLKHVLKLQKKATNAFRESFADEPTDDSDEEEEKCCYDLEEDEKFRFFLGVFVDGDELRRYYEENFECGEFFCIVCGGVGGKGSGKRFKSCHGLVQHASAVSKTETNRSHQAFGVVVCKVLGWDFDKIPNLVSKGEPLGRTLDNGGGKQKPVETFDGAVKEDNDDSKFFEEKTETTGRDEGELSEVADENDRKDVNEGSSEKSAESKSASLDQPLSQLGISEVLEQPPVPSSLDTVGWPILTRPNLAPPLSAEAQALVAADQLQLKAVKLCRAFLMANSNSSSNYLDDNDDYEEEDDSSEDSETENDGSGDSSKELDFFLKLFSDDAELRDFYCCNSEKRDFCCLVCGGIGEKVWKRFKGCVALVQHSAGISKTRRKLAHRAYGRAVCQILGWDANRFL